MEVIICDRLYSMLTYSVMQAFENQLKKSNVSYETQTEMNRLYIWGYNIKCHVLGMCDKCRTGNTNNTGNIDVRI